MANHQELVVYELNDETVAITIASEDADTAYDLTDVRPEMFVEPSTDTPDAEAGLAEVHIDRVHLATMASRPPAG